MESTDSLGFSDVFPLPFKILHHLEYGTLLWFLLVVICTRFTEINVLQLLNLSYSPHNYNELERTIPPTGEFATFVPAEFKENSLLAAGIWHNFKSIAIFNLVGFVVYKIVETLDNDSTVFKAARSIIPSFLFGYTLTQLFYKSTNSKGQFRMFTTIKRVLLGNINSKTMRTNDILISDSLVSFAKVINDFALFLWTYHISSKPYNNVVELIVLSIPLLVRMKQCWYEYSVTKQKAHLLNLVKYLSGLGPLTINYLIKVTLSIPLADQEEHVKQPIMDKLGKLNWWWYVFAAINSMYSFIWDVKMDWGFELFDTIFKPKGVKKPFRMVRSKHTLHYHPLVYYLAIWLDFTLRFLWILKFFIVEEELQNQDITYVHLLSTFLFGYDSYSLGYTIIETLEIFRRWVWCFFKLESDWVKINTTEGVEMVTLVKES